MQGEKNIPELVKRAVFEIDHEAEVYLFGSRARGDFNDESDWDFLILTEWEVSLEYKKKIRIKLYEIEIKLGIVINSMIKNKMQWEDYQLSVLYQNINHDQIKI